VRLHRVLALACVLGAAAFVTRAAELRARDEKDENALGQPRMIAFAVVASPLAIVEASGAGHNDAWLLLFTAAALWALASKRALLACAIAAASASIKPTGVLVAGVFVGCVIAWRVGQRLRPSEKTVARAAIALAVVAVGAAALLLPWLRTFTWTFDADRPPMTTERALEAIPRGLLYGAGRRDLAFALGLVVRACGVAWIAWQVARSASEKYPLARAAPALFGFYVFFSGTSHGWYLLPLLALAPVADARWRRALAVSFATYGVTYALALPWQCGFPGVVAWGWVLAVEGVIANCVPLGLRWVDRERANARAHAGAR
jgi:hypothetical protein